MIFKDFPKGRFCNADCFEAMQAVPSGVIDLILCDLPYGTTQCKWDSILPFGVLWNEYKRVAKPNAAIVLTASQPFTTALIASNYKDFKYVWHWDKVNGIRNHLNAKRQPMRKMEDICVFYDEQCTYNPQMREGSYVSRKTKPGQSDGFGTVSGVDVGRAVNGLYPVDLLQIKSHNPNNSIHPTQKPVELFEYLIKTYTNENGVVLDNTAGSGTTAIAAINTNRIFFCIEREENYYAKAIARIENHSTETIQAPITEKVA